jgi:hypothetical protein
MTDLLVAAPDGVDDEAMDSTVGGIDAEELDTEDEKHLVVVGLDVNQGADRTEGQADLLDCDSHGSVISLGELPDGVLGVGVDQDGELNLTLELVEQGSVLSLGQGVLVSGEVLDNKAVLPENVFALCSFVQVVVPEVHTAAVYGNTTGKAGILVDGQ